MTIEEMKYAMEEIVDMIEDADIGLDSRPAGTSVKDLTDLLEMAQTIADYVEGSTGLRFTRCDRCELSNAATDWISGIEETQEKTERIS